MGTHSVGGDSDRSWELGILAPVGTVGTGHDESVDRGSHERPRHLHGHPWDTGSAKATKLAARQRHAPLPPDPHSRYAVTVSRSLGLGVSSMVSAV